MIALAMFLVCYPIAHALLRTGVASRLRRAALVSRERARLRVLERELWTLRLAEVNRKPESYQLPSKRGVRDWH